MDLPTLWFIVVAVFWIGFFVLEGFDFGVGALHQVVGKTDTERRVAINAIGPFWDANEVWLIVGGAAIFAAFPAWYAAMFSALYLPLVIVLIALIVRGVAFEWRHRGQTQRWRSAWSWGLSISSVLVPLLLGVGVGNLLVGLPINESGDYVGTVTDLLTGYGLLTGVTVLALALLHGALFLTMKTTDPVRERAHRLAGLLWTPAAGLAIAWIVATHAVADSGALALALQVVAVVALILVLPTRASGRDGRAFAANAVAIAAAVGSLFATLAPNVMVSSLDPANTLTIANAASGQYSLTVMTIVAAVLLPLVLLYQGWSYYAFRHRVQMPAG